MAFTATPVDGSATPIPMSSAVPDGTNTPLALEGGPSITTGGNTLVPVSVWIKDGNDVTLGAQADVSATTDTGTFSLMALVKRALTRLTSLVTNTNAFIDTSTTGTVAVLNDVVSMALPGGQATATVQILMGTLVGTLNFEASPDSGTTWYSIQGNQVGTSTFALTTTAAGAWRFNVSGFTNFRVRLGPVTSGTSGTITIRLSNGVNNLAISNATALGQQLKAASAPVVLPSDQIVPIQGGYVDLPVVVTSLANGSLVVGPFDVSGYTWGTFQATGTYSMSLGFQGSMNGTTWDSIAWQQMKTTTAQALNTSYGTSGQIYGGPLSCRYFQVIVSAFTSNTSLNAYCRAFANPPAQLLTQLPITNTATTLGGTTPFHLISAATTNATAVKVATGMVYGISVSNSNAAARYLKIYNKAAAPTVGTDTPILTLQVPANGSRDRSYPLGLALGTGIAIATTTGIADSDAVAVGLSDLSIDLDFK